MKKMAFLGVMILGATFLSVSAQDQTEKLKETVSVTNVEVPLRVFYKGQPVENLTRDDFRLYEGDKAQTINGFFVKRKKINTQDILINTGGRQAYANLRYFVLVFRIIDYNESMKKAVEFLFTKVLRPDDQILIFANDRTLFMDESFKGLDRQKVVEEMLRTEGVKALQRLMSYFSLIQRQLNATKLEIKMERDVASSQLTPVSSRPDKLLDFLQRYLGTWKEYKIRYLLPDIDRYYNFAHFLEKISRQKWVINFYQVEMFPKMKVSSELRQQIEQLINEIMASRSEDYAYSQLLMDLLTQIDKELNVASDFPVEELSRLFYKVEATCHSILCGIQKEALSEDLEFRQVNSDVENVLREVTINTGGTLIASGDLESALHTIGEKEDVYYVLTYEPSEAQKIGKIRVEVNNREGKNYKILYDSHMREDYIKEYIDKRRAESPTVLLGSVAFKEGKLSLDIRDFLMNKLKEGNRGRLEVRVHIKDTQDRVIYDKNRYLDTRQKVVTLSIDFAWLKAGDYNIVVEATDLLTEKSAMDFLSIHL